ncbi:MAG: HXXEE domain-containing protein [Solirubrobacteraceae bacterium]|nr:HXXEE domain-containing protein [Solirubrobacteraceae bacterium]
MRVPSSLRNRDTHGTWPWVAAAAAAPSTVAACIAQDTLRRDGNWALWLPLPVLFWHQTEEWVVPGGFLPWFNREVAGSGQDEFPITRTLGLIINTGAGWALCVAAGAAGRERPLLPAASLTMFVTNAGLHGGRLAADRAYNPGSATGTLLMLPLGVLGIARLLRDPEVENKQVLKGVAAGVVASAALMAVMQVRVRLSRGSRGRRR